MSVTTVTCAHPECTNTFERNGSPGRPKVYCDHPHCIRARAADRKARERAVAYNTLILVEAPLPELSKRRTSEPGDGDQDGSDFQVGATSRYDELARVWQDANVWRPSNLPECRGVPALDDDGRRLAKLRDVTRLLDDAVRGVRSLHRSAGAPVGLLSKPRNEDHDCPGERWLRGQKKQAVEKAEAALRREQDRCEHLPDGYLEGGALWDGLGLNGPNFDRTAVWLGQDMETWKHRRIRENRSRRTAR
jgi:hypothetical protein